MFSLIIDRTNWRDTIQRVYNGPTDMEEQLTGGLKQLETISSCSGMIVLSSIESVKLFGFWASALLVHLD